MVKSLTITGFGINCEAETGAAYKLAGAENTTIHFNELMDGKFQLKNYDILNFPGGFSFGDDIESGKVMANKLKYKKLKTGKSFMQDIEIFLAEGKYILGICNGFQILVQLGLLPAVEGTYSPQASLQANDSGKFEDRWVHCKVKPESKNPFLSGLDIIELPVRHGEGKLIFKNEATRKSVIKQNLISLQYSDEKGNPTGEYPANPNGSELNAAGLIDSSRQIFGLMPHPEAFLSFYNHPDRAQLSRKGEIIKREQTGLAIFDNIVNHIKSKKQRAES